MSEDIGMKPRPSRYKKQPQVFDVRVFVQPEDGRTEALYTLSIDRHIICGSTPLSLAMARFQSYLEKRTEEA